MKEGEEMGPIYTCDLWRGLIFRFLLIPRVSLTVCSSLRLQTPFCLCYHTSDYTLQALSG